MGRIGPQFHRKKIYYIILKFNNKKCVTVFVVNTALKFDCPLMIITHSQKMFWRLGLSPSS